MIISFTRVTENTISILQSLRYDEENSWVEPVSNTWLQHIIQPENAAYIVNIDSEPTGYIQTDHEGTNCSILVFFGQNHRGKGIFCQF